MLYASSEEINQITSYADDVFATNNFEKRIVEYSTPSNKKERIHLTMNTLPRVELERNPDGSLTERCFCSVTSFHKVIDEEEFTSFYLISYNYFANWALLYASMNSSRTNALLSSERVFTEEEMRENPDFLSTKGRVFHVFSENYPYLNLTSRCVALLYMVPEVFRGVSVQICCLYSVFFDAVPKLITGKPLGESFKVSNEWLETLPDSASSLCSLFWAILSPEYALKAAKKSVKGDLSDKTFRTYETLENYNGKKRLLSY